MSKQGKSRKPLIIGIIAAVVILAALLAVLLTNCVGQGGNEATTESTSNEVPTYQLYWNVDKAEYSGKSEAGMSSREPDEDGMFSVRFVLDGELITLRVANRRLINTIDIQDVVGLEFDDKGVVVGVLTLDDMPLEKVGWQFFVQSAASKLIKLNSAESLNGMEVMLEGVDPNRIWDMSGKSGPIGCVTEPMELDKVMAVQNLAGEVTHVFIYERPNFMLTHEAYCEHCKQEVTWKEWVKTDVAPTTDGHYQLQNDITAKVQTKIQEDAKLCLDLNGYRIDGKENLGRLYSMFNPGVTFAVMDTSEAQTGAIAAHGRGDQGMCVWVRYGAFYLYSGTLDASDATTTIRGAGLEVAGNAFAYMYGGKITGGTVSYKLNESTGKYTGGHGGNVGVGGKFVMYDGIIENGKGDPRIVMKDGSPTYSFGAGGNMYITGVFEMHGGTIRNGRTANAGGNIYIAGSAEVTMDGGTISGGTITGKGRNGGSIYIGSTKAVFNMNGGSIVGGSSRNGGGVVYSNGTFNMRGGSISGGKLYNYTTGKLSENPANANFFLVNGTLNMSGGKIDGSVQAIDTNATDKLQCTVNLSGSAKIFNAEGKQRSLTISGGGSGVKVKVGNMGKNAKVGIYTTIGVFSEPTKAANVDKFFSDIEGAGVILYNDRLALGAAYCLCGASKGNDTALDQLNHKAGCSWKSEGDLLWQPYTGDVITKDSNVYLTKDLAVSQRTIGVEEKKDKETGEITQQAEGRKLNLDLNGYTLSAAKVNTRVFYVMKGSSLTITDSGKGGTMKGMGHKDQSGVILMGGNTAVTLIDGTITMDKDGTVSSGGISQIPASGTFTMYNGTISNGSALKNGGIFDVCGKLYVYNGVITGGKAVGQGGNIYAREKSEVILSGNTQVTNGECVPAEEGAARANGGNISVAGSSTVTIRDNVLISGGLANNGGNIVVYSHLIVEGGTIKDGICKNASGSVTSTAGMNIAGVHKTSHIDIRGGKIAGGVYINCYGNGEPLVSLSGAPVVDKALTSEGVRKPAYSLDYRNTKAIADPEVKIDASGLTKGAKIGIFAYSHFGTKGNTTNRGYFFSEVKNTGIALIDGGLYLGEAYCLCGASKGNDTALKDLTHKLGCTWETEGELLWQPYTGGNILKSGNYYLADTVTTNQAVMGQAEEKKDGEITKEAISVKVNLDLNGQTWKSAGRAMYILNESVVTITDSEGSGTIIGGGHKDQSGVILTAGKAVVNLIDGEVTMAEGATSSKAGIMEVAGNVTFNMYGGTITNGTTTGVGGSLNVKGTFNMYGGEISGGKSNGTGGNINIEATGKVMITGNAKVFGGECVLFEEGKARNNGGNICLYGNLTIGGNAEIYDGISNAGGNIVVYSHLIVKDNAKIYDGITTNMNNAVTTGSGMNISAISAGHVDIRGGQIAGGVQLNCWGSGEPKVSLSGAPVINKELTSDGVREPAYSLDYRNTKPDPDVDMAVKLDVSSLTDGAWIGITAVDHFAVNANATIRKYFHPDASGVDVSLIGTDLRLGTFYCLCGASKGNDTALDQLSHKPGCTWETAGELKWQAYDISHKTADGNYYLTGKTTQGQQVHIKEGAKVNLDLNGYVLEGTSSRLFQVNAGHLTITDSYVVPANNTDTNRAGGKIIAKGTNSATEQSGMFLFLGSGSSVTLIDGELTMKSGGIAARGGIADIPAGYTFRIYGGEVYGAASRNNGGLFDVKGTLNISGGTISGGTAAGAGGCIMINNGGNVKISGGTITGGTATNTKGGNIAVADGGILEISGNATVNGGVYVNSNNVTLKGNALTIDKGTTTQPYSLQVVAGKTVDVKDLTSGANVKVTAEAGSAFAKNATEAHLAFIKQEDGSDVILDQGFLYTSMYANITGCVCGMPNGTHLTYNADGTTVKCDEQVLTWKPWTSKTSLPTDAGNYYLINNIDLTAQTTISADVKIDLNGKTVTAKSDIGAMQAVVIDGTNGKLTITNTKRDGDGKVEGGIVNSNTYTFFRLNNGGTLNLYHVDMGMTTTSTTDGGLIDVNNGTVNVFGDTVIHDGKVANNCNAGNMKIRASGTLNLYSGTVKDGRCGSDGSKNGGNIQAEGVLNMYGGLITGGKKGTNTAIASGNVWGVGSASRLNLFGGIIDGDISLYYSNAQTCPVVTLKGSININNGANCGLTVMYKDNPIKIAGALTGSVTVTYKGTAEITAGNPVAFAEAAGEYTITAADAEKFVSTNGYVSSLGTDGKVYMGLVATRDGCICGQNPHVTGCNEAYNIWTPWSKTDSLPTEAGNYYLTNNVTLTAAQAGVTGANIQLDLNGKTVTVPGSVSMYTGSASILVTDTTTAGDGKILVTGALTNSTLDIFTNNMTTLFRGSMVVDDTVTFDSFISTGVVSASNAAKITTKDGVQNVYVFPEALANSSDEVGRLYIGKIGCICGNTHNTDSLVCDGSVHIWTKTDARATGDGNEHYNYLADALTVTSQITLNNSGSKIYLDLNGFNINANGGRFYRIQNSDTVVLTNTSAKQSQIIVNNGGDQGRILWGQANAVIRVYNVDVAMAKATLTQNNEHQNGIAFALAGANANAIFQNVDFTADAETKAATNGMYLSATSSSNVILKSCTMTGGYANRAHLIGTSTTERSDGTGGAIHMAGTAKVKLIDTSITGNTAARDGAGVYMDGGANGIDTPELTLAGTTTITGNKLADNTVNNLRVNPTGTVKIEEGFSGTVGVSGSADNGLFPNVKKADALVTGGKLVIDNTTAYQWVDYTDGLGLGDATKIYRCECGGKAVGKDGHTCVDLEWTEWTSDNSLPNTTGNYVLTKNITATGQVSLGSGKTVHVDLNGKNIHMDYTNYGKSFDAWRTYRVDKGAVLTITDSTANPGTFTSSKPAAGTQYAGTDKTQVQFDASIENGASGMLLWVYGGDATVYDGIFDGSTLNGKKSGMPIWMYPYNNNGNGSLTVYGGTFKGATTTVNGGIIYAELGSTVNIKGGTFNGGNVGNSGGAIYAQGIVVGDTTYTTEVNISGGLITGGQASKNGGNIAVGGYAKLTLSGDAQITNGVIKYSTSMGQGGNIFVDTNGEMDMSGGTVKGGFRYKDANNTKDTNWRFANVTSKGAFTMTGGTIEGRTYLVSGTATLSGNAYIVGGNSLSLEPAVDLTIGTLTEKANIKFFLQGSEFTSASKWNNGTVAIADTGEGLTAKMVEDYLQIGVYQGSGTYTVVLNNGKLYIENTPAQ